MSGGLPVRLYDRLERHTTHKEIHHAASITGTFVNVTGGMFPG